MGQVSVTQINTGDPLDPAVVDANFNAVLNEINGNLQAITNIQIAAAASVPGWQNTAGSSASLAAADHTHIIQGVENLTLDPASGNFAGRLWFDTSTKQWKGISDLSGPVVNVIGNPSATDLVHHASQHADGAADQLADTSIAERSMKAKTVVVGQIPSDVGTISNGGFTTVQDISVTTTGQQTLLVIATMRPTNAAGSRCIFYWRVRDVTNSNATIYRSNVTRLDPTSGGNDETEVGAAFFYTTPSGGARTLRLAAGADNANVTISAIGSPGGDSTASVTPNLQAVIL